MPLNDQKTADREAETPACSIKLSMGRAGIYLKANRPGQTAEGEKN
jgi:hypothetical protein